MAIAKGWSLFASTVETRAIKKFGGQTSWPTNISICVTVGVPLVRVPVLSNMTVEILKKKQKNPNNILYIFYIQQKNTMMVHVNTKKHQNLSNETSTKTCRVEKNKVYKMRWCEPHQIFEKKTVHQQVDHCIRLCLSKIYATMQVNIYIPFASFRVVPHPWSKYHFVRPHQCQPSQQSVLPSPMRMGMQYTTRLLRWEKQIPKPLRLYLIQKATNEKQVLQR